MENKFNITLKDMIGVITIVAGITGAYFLGEGERKQASSDIVLLKAEVKDLRSNSETIIRLEERFKNVEEKTNEIYRIVTNRGNIGQ